MINSNMLSFENVRDITMAVIKYMPALDVLPDIADEEDFDFLEEQEDFFKNKLKQELQDYLDEKQVDFEPILEIINKTNDALEAFEVDNDEETSDLFEKIKHGNLNKKFVIDSIVKILLDLYDGDIYNGIKIFMDKV